VPTGVAIRDPRAQLFEAAERVLLRDGSSGLTSRAVTTEAGVAKGVLHRHFADFDAFLTDLALDHVARIGAVEASLRAAAGTGSVTGNLTAVLPDLFSPVILALIRLVIMRDELRSRLRAATGARFPMVTESVAAVASYLDAEQDLGRVPAGADTRALARALIGATNLAYADTDGTPDAGAIADIVTTVLAPAQLTAGPDGLPGLP
jgi:AcrR family transcriptional regulator